MSVQGLSISTNHPFNIYKGGETIKGKVHFKLAAPKKIRAIYVKLKGIAVVSWKERERRTTRKNESPRYITYTGEQEYFNEKIYFIRVADDTPLPAGEYHYQFEYILPIGIPSPVEESSGSIRYTIKAVIDIPWGFDEEETIQLAITSAVNLNENPRLKSPFNAVVTKNLCCLCCRSGPLTMTIILPKTGYARGENMLIIGDIENLTNSAISTIDCTLKKTITLHSDYPQHHTKESTKNVCSVKLGDVPVRSSRNYEKNLMIPNDLVFNVDNCRLINIQYKLKIEAYIEGCHLNLTTEIPITIGDVPLMDRETAPRVSVLAGLGTPYPYETQERNFSQIETPSAPVFANLGTPYPYETQGKNFNQTETPSAPVLPSLGTSYPYETQGKKFSQTETTSASVLGSLGAPYPHVTQERNFRQTETTSASVLGGLGTPYPHETQERSFNQIETTAALLSKSFNWMK